MSWRIGPPIFSGARVVGVVAALIGLACQALPDVAAQTMPMGAGPTVCQLDQLAFCDTFDAPYTGGGRTGQLDPSRWAVSRLTSDVNPGQGIANLFVPTQAMFCRTPISGLQPDLDYFFCGPEFGESMHFMEAIEDNGNYVYNDAMVRQAFDFADRTGSIVFDVDAKNEDEHSWWVEVWVTDDPVPAPHTDNPGVAAHPRNGLGIIFNDDCGAPGRQGTVHHIAVSNDYSISEKPIASRACYVTTDDMKNHFQVKLSQQRVEIWATDPMQDNLRLVAAADNLNLAFSRGYVHFEHAQYNAGKFNSSSHQTYHWDNIGFDGPSLAPLRGYDVPDALAPTHGGLNLGYSLAGGPKSFSLDNVVTEDAHSAWLDLNVWATESAPGLQYRLNQGAWHALTAPANAAGSNYQWRGLSIPVNLGDLQPGPNSLELSGDSPVIVANVDLSVSGAQSSPAPSALPTPMDPQADMSMPMPAGVPGSMDDHMPMTPN